MIDAIINFAIRNRWLVMVAVVGIRGLRLFSVRAPADRRRAGHHERAGADQYAGAGLFPARSRAARHVSRRDGDGGHAET